MKRTLRFVALAAIVALSSWVNVEATEPTVELVICTASQDLVGDPGALTDAFTSLALTCRQQYDECAAQCNPQDSLCFQDCQCQFLMCKGYQCN
jgi:hypothetical protein